jgi:hypothetical protein
MQEFLAKSPSAYNPVLSPAFSSPRPREKRLTLFRSESVVSMIEGSDGVGFRDRVIIKR